MERRISLGRKLIFSAVMLAFFLGALELALRLTVTGFPYQQSHPEYGISLVPNYIEYDERGNEKLHINSLGFRGTEFGRENAETTAEPFRIFALGDSTTFGLRPESCPYPAQLEKLIGGSYENVEVINAGIEGNTSTLALKRLTGNVLPLKPNMVLIAVGWNDLYTTNPEAAGSAGALRGAADFFNRSYLFKALRKIIFKWLKPKVIVKNDDAAARYEAYEPSAFKENLAKMIAETAAAGAQPVLMTLPMILSEKNSPEALARVHYPHFTNSAQALRTLAHRYNDSIRTVARSNGAMLIDNAAYFDSLPDKEQYFFDTVHVYCEGNGLLAQNIFNELIKSGRLGIRE